MYGYYGEKLHVNGSLRVNQNCDQIPLQKSWTLSKICHAPNMWPHNSVGSGTCLISGRPGFLSCQSLNCFLLFYTLTSVSIFSILFSIHFLQYWQGEFIWQSELHRLVIIFFILMILMNDSVYHCKEKLDASHSGLKWLLRVPICSQPVRIISLLNFHPQVQSNKFQ